VSNDRMFKKIGKDFEESGSFIIRNVAVGTFSLSQHTTTHSHSQTACFFLRER
jgi:hypothetical protein